MSDELFRPREIVDARDIPMTGTAEVVGLISAHHGEASRLCAAGARQSKLGRWYILREAGVDLRSLSSYLPRLALPVVVPTLVDLIPETSWGASLANVLDAGSWRRVREMAIASAGGCQDCGFGDALECHEIWSYDDDRGVQRLIELRSLCRYCHETHHLGLARVKGRYKTAVARLAALNRLLPREIDSYVARIDSHWVRRSRRDWVLDLSLVARMGLMVKPGFVARDAHCVTGETHRGETLVRVLGAQFTTVGKRIEITQAA